jgi:hypothetical protein
MTSNFITLIYTGEHGAEFSSVSPALRPLPRTAGRSAAVPTTALVNRREETNQREKERG